MQSIRDSLSVNSSPEGEPDALPGWKRALDVGLSLAAMPLLGACALGMATVMALVSPGPLLYRRERVGRGGRRFLCYRVRTMHVVTGRGVEGRRPAERFIPGGWFLRASGLDNLPRILNVLSGEMSLVGPHPCLPEEFAQLGSWRQARSRALPGVTGLWQVSSRNWSTLSDLARLDLHYIEHRSLGLDLKILARTVPAMLRQVRDAGGQRRALRKAASSAEV